MITEGEMVDVGMRIQYEGDRGTVRYVGPLQGRGDTVWVGIEWDRAERGKHNGTVDGVKYFECENESGSLIKLKRIGNGGRSNLMQAVRMRYERDVKDDEFRKKTMRIGGGVVAIANRKVQRICELEVVDVSEYGVCCVGNAEELRNVRELSVAKCLFGWMGELCEVVDEVKRLRRLDASHNVLMHGRRRNMDGGGSAVEEVVLNHCKVRWEGIAEICESTNGLRVLRVHDCGLGAIQSEVGLQLKGRLSALEKIDLDKNCIGWEEVMILGELQSLREAYLSENGLEDIEIERDDVFKRLEVLSLANNRMEGWAVVSWLQGLCSLRELRVRGNPMCEGEEFAESGSKSALTWRMRVVGRVAGLRILDGTVISDDERLFCEKRYLGEEVLKDCEQNGEARTRRMHARFEELLQRFGTVKREMKRLGEDLVVVQVVSEGKSATRRMPRSTDIRRAARVLRRALRVGRGGTVDVGVAREDGVVWLRDDDDSTVGALSSGNSSLQLLLRIS
ncbi:Tubulin-specific chaperone E [Gracilariopsis chorda]|uniref:Tubulin-specific chaperone E n=1 Tax=Gracilariopsis chorda TaxID=448386 RepID=A0A2V3J6B6_9FLOR|nr:Tubulin-specific chaperone E [Gracilariopsis chorda]|eukprot:PXF49949.1 Tubulin-specific chaperone E [Gracilariopsis chorda]